MTHMSIVCFDSRSKQRFKESRQPKEEDLFLYISDLYVAFGQAAQEVIHASQPRTSPELDCLIDATLYSILRPSDLSAPLSDKTVTGSCYRKSLNIDSHITTLTNKHKMIIRG
jgi:hypothetical protein